MVSYGKPCRDGMCTTILCILRRWYAAACTVIDIKAQWLAESRLTSALSAIVVFVRIRKPTQSALLYTV